MPTARGRGDAVAPSRLLARLAAVLVAALLLGLLAGCGVGAQDRGEPAPLPEALPTPPRPPGSGGGEDLVVHFVSGTHLSPVRRAVPERRPQDAVDLLLAGPTRAEVLSGLRTALSPQHLSVLTGPDHGGTVTVTVTRGFTGIGGDNQLLAVAQVVCCWPAPTSWRRTRPRRTPAPRSTAARSARTPGGDDDVSLLQVQLEYPLDGVYGVGEDARLFMAVSNTGGDPVTLTDISGPDFGGVEVVTAEGQGLPLTVDAQDNLYVGAEGPPEVTLLDLGQELRSSQSIPVTFTFAEAGEVTIDVPVSAEGQRPTNPFDFENDDPDQDPTEDDPASSSPAG